MKHLYLAFALAALAQGCAGMAKNLLQNVPDDYKLSANDPTALVVLSTRFVQGGCTGGSSMGSVSAALTKESSKPSSQMLWMVSPLLQSDSADPTRQLSIRKIEPGQYVISQINYAYSLTNSTIADNIRIPFTVAAGQAYYLGELTVTAKDCKTLTAKITNQRKRDMALFATRLKNVPPASVQDQILN